MKVIFLGRDSVINQEIGYLHKSKDFKFIDGVFEACKYFQSLGYKLIIITNQSGIARGYYQEEGFHILTKWMLVQFKNQVVDILDVFLFAWPKVILQMPQASTRDASRSV
jgi:D-glycero-D-manno-heptose 1,7-bisphosphate phosphatase